MNQTVAQEDIDIYASDSLAAKAIPDQTNYGLGVKVNWTAPAKWWNWLWNRMTSILKSRLTDTDNIREEMASVLGEAGLTPADGTKRQLANSIEVMMFDDYKKWDELPYVIDHKVYLPINEIL